LEVLGEESGDVEGEGVVGPSVGVQRGRGSGGRLWGVGFCGFGEEANGSNLQLVEVDGAMGGAWSGAWGGWVGGFDCFGRGGAI
jgi:hypothetical protein